MTSVEPISEVEAEGAVAEIYGQLRLQNGNVPNYGKAFSLRPELFSGL